MVEHVSYVSQTINKIRWKPISFSLEQSDLFVTGSCEEYNDTVSLWDISHMKNQANDSIDSDGEVRNPNKLSSAKVGGVATLSFMKEDSVLVGSISGSVSHFTIDKDKNLSQTFTWPNLHSKYGGCTGCDPNLPDIATVGEDGSIHIIHVGCERPLHSIINGDSSSITAVRWFSSSELCTCNSFGHLRVWDIRSANSGRVILSNEKPVALYSLDHHPSKTYMLATGDADGCVTFFDIRQEKAAVAKVQLHEYDIWEVCFNKQSPDMMFSCSGDGTARKLDTSSNLTSYENDEDPIQITEVFSETGPSINSIDVSGNDVVCATESNAIYLLHGDSNL